jgi:hypothetical protein
MKTFMEEQVERILQDYAHDAPKESIDLYALAWIAANAFSFRVIYCLTHSTEVACSV